MIAVCIYKNLYYDDDKKRALTFVSALFCNGRGRRTRTLNNGFGDRDVTITLCPYLLWWAFRDSNPKPTGYEPVALTN